jgi:hypothetical protein
MLWLHDYVNLHILSIRPIRICSTSLNFVYQSVGAVLYDTSNRVRAVRHATSSFTRASHSTISGRQSLLSIVSIVWHRYRSLRSDPTLQEIANKLIPHLQKLEEKREEQFCRSRGLVYHFSGQCLFASTRGVVLPWMIRSARAKEKGYGDGATESWRGGKLSPRRSANNGVPRLLRWKRRKRCGVESMPGVSSEFE